MRGFRNILKNVILPPTIITVLVVVLVGFVAMLMSLVIEIKNLEDTKVELYNKLALIILLLWIALLITYYAWLIYFYNFNYGKSAAFWKKFIQMAHDEKANKTEAQLYEELAAPNRNPFYDQTFGLPPGTVRGTLALTVVIGGLCLLILVIGGNPLFVKESFDRHLNFFEQAFLMVIAFYFGTKAFEIIQQQQTERVKARSKKEPDVSLPVVPSEADMDGSTPTSATPVANNLFQPSKPAFVSPTAVSTAAASTMVPKTVTKEKMIDNNLNLFYPHVKDLEVQGVLQEDEIKAFADKWGLEVAAVKAVIKVESSGKGFLKDGRPKILFEGHVFWRQLKSHGIDPTPFAKDHPTILYPKWTKQYYLTGSLEYNRLNEAKQIHESAALESASWGMFQIMGFHWSAMKYASVQAFVEGQEKSEEEHLAAFGLFISQVSKPCLEALKTRNWATFAKFYNGADYAKNQYDTKLANWYNTFQEQHA